MTHSHSKVVRIVDQKGQTTLSRTQKSFNKLIKKIDAQRKILAAWQATIPLYHQKYASEFDPLLDVFKRHQLQLVHLLDLADADTALSKTDKTKI